MNKFTKSRQTFERFDQGSLPSVLSVIDTKISPADFMAFLPWACGQLEIDAILDITRNQSDYVSLYDRDHKVKKSAKMVKTLNSAISSMDQDKEKDVKSLSSVRTIDEKRTVFITATFTGDHLAHIKIDKTRHLPRKVLRILGLIVQFYPQLYGISIHSGVDCYTIYELSKLLPLSNITELSLDKTFVQEGNYDMLLDTTKQLKVLSLAHCRLGDEVVEKIVSKIEYPQRASETLCVLNLSSNRLTDKSAEHLAAALRTNRQLKYLNLASNMITEVGMDAMLRIFSQFPLTVEETMITRRKRLAYLKDINSLTEQFIEGFRVAGEFEKKAGTKKGRSGSAATSSRKGTKVKSDPTEALTEAIYYEKAKDMATSFKGLYKDPFGTDCYSQDGIVYSNGNNTLSYLNVAYNSISYNSLKSLLKVLKHQKLMGRSPRGLLKVCLEGNPLPSCVELTEINMYLDVGLMVLDRRGSTVSRKLLASLKK